MCHKCVCATCGARAVGALPDGTLLCLPHYEEVLRMLGMNAGAESCRRCGDEKPEILIPEAHGLFFCGPCHIRYYRILRDTSLRAPDVLTAAHPELADVAAVYASADAAGVWDPWL